MEVSRLPLQVCEWVVGKLVSSSWWPGSLDGSCNVQPQGLCEEGSRFGDPQLRLWGLPGSRLWLSALGSDWPASVAFCGPLPSGWCLPLGLLLARQA